MSQSTKPSRFQLLVIGFIWLNSFKIDLVKQADKVIRAQPILRRRKKGPPALITLPACFMQSHYLLYSHYETHVLECKWPARGGEKR